MRNFKGWVWVGLCFVLIYWWSIGPVGVVPDGHRYFFAEDTCSHQMARQFMGENLAKEGKPTYFTDKVMAPYGTNMAFFAGWNFERDFLGGLVWNLNPKIPFLWFYFGCSLLLSYFAVGWILRKMSLGALAAWSLATLVVVFNLPRHFKIWHHSDNIMMHWIYIGFFWDAFIWHRAVRERKWTLSAEAWRGLWLLLICWTMGYYWGPAIMEWALVRAGLLWLLWKSEKGTFEWSLDWKRILLPVTLILVVVAIDLYWFVPLLKEANKFGKVDQIIGYFANAFYLIRPLWFERILSVFGTSLPFNSFYFPETPISVGWGMLTLLFMSVWVIRKRKGGPGWKVFAPFALFLIIAVAYAIRIRPVYHVIQMIVPFMMFFRTASRFGYFMPILIGILAALSAPEMARYWGGLSLKQRKKAFAILFVVAALEISWLAVPVFHSPPMSDQAYEMVNKIKEAPGTTVLSLPFCVAGANGVCSGQQCSRYPYQMIGMCLRPYHEKKVYGIYSSRLGASDCQIYNREPYNTWFNAWRENRCFEGAEWKQFCTYLGEHSELSALLIFPEIWGGGGASSACLSQFEAHLGKPLSQADVIARSGPGQDIRPDIPTKMIWFTPRCISQ